jgi:hypothetical protein
MEERATEAQIEKVVANLVERCLVWWGRIASIPP